MENPEEAIDILQRVGRMGVTLAIDDFGTGYSSLSYLKRLPAEKLKIDKSFVRDITVDPTDAAMVRAILQMADAFGMQTVAEGVETAEQAEALHWLGCTYGQGYLYSRAIDRSAISTLLKERRVIGRPLAADGAVSAAG